VADDEEIVRDLAQDTLEEQGFNVLLACDGQEAVDAFRNHADDIRAVLLDLSMPVLNGTEALREIHAIRPDMPAILSSGYTEQDAFDKFSLDCSAAFIQKPYAPQKLLATLRTVLKE
jgi:CheY-like chemotaxis protein